MDNTDRYLEYKTKYLQLKYMNDQIGGKKRTKKKNKNKEKIEYIDDFREWGNYKR